MRERLVSCDAGRCPGRDARFAANLIVDEDGHGSLNNCDAAAVTPYTTIQAALMAAAPGDTDRGVPRRLRRAAGRGQGGPPQRARGGHR